MHLHPADIRRGDGLPRPKSANGRGRDTSRHNGARRHGASDASAFADERGGVIRDAITPASTRAAAPA